MEVPRFAAVGLSLMLAANCFMPCYTLAYADEPQGVPDVFEEEQKEVSDDAIRLELSPGSGESISYGSDGDPAAEGHGGDLEASEGSGQDIAPDNGGLDGAVVYDTELSADYPLVEEGDGGIDESFSGFGGDDSASVDYGISPQAIIGGSIVDALIVSSVSGDWNGFQYGNVKWNTNRGTLFWLLSLQFTYIVQQTGIAQAYFKATDTNTKNTVSQISSLRDQIGPAQKGTSLAGWVYTMVVDLQELKSNLGGLQNGVSVSGWLHTLVSNVQTLSNNIGGQQHGASLSGWVYTLVTEIQALRDQIGPLQRDSSLSSWVYTIAGGVNSVYNRLGDINDNIGGQQHGASLSGWVYTMVVDLQELKSNLGALQNGVSVSGWLHTLVSNVQTLSNNIGGQQHGASLSGWVYTLVTEIQALRDQIGPFQNETSLSGWVWTIAVKSTNIYDLLDNATKGPEGGRVSLYNMGNAVETIKNETRDLDNLLESVHDRLSALDALGVRLANIALIADEIKKGVNSSLQWYDTLHGDLSMLRHGAADLLPGYADWTVWDFLQGIYFDVGQIVDLLKGLQQTLTAWGDRWDSQDLYLMEWAKRWDALDKGGSWSESDKSLLFAKLDGISDRLSVEAGQTILDALLGEVKPQYINDQLTIVKEVARNRFPFCIPAMMQQMLGLMQSEAQVPHWEFDFFGSPLVLDLGDLEGFASVTRWASCFMLFLALLANTKRFIFDLGGGGK